MLARRRSSVMTRSASARSPSHSGSNSAGSAARSAARRASRAADALAGLTARGVAGVVDRPGRFGLGAAGLAAVRPGLGASLRAFLPSFMARTIHARGDGGGRSREAAQIEAREHAFKAAMSRDLKTFCLRIAALGAAACSSAYAVHSGSEGEPLAAVGQPIARSPYEVELLGADGRTLATYERGDRFYILGQAGDRYSIRVSNPTPRRVEAI